MKARILSVMAAVIMLSFSDAGNAGNGGLPHLQVRDARIVDDNGSTVILRGVAVNQLGDYFQANPQIPATIPLERSDFEQIAA